MAQNKKTIQNSKESKSQKESENSKKMLFSKKNYLFMLIGLAIIVLGFVLMAGGGSDDPNVFNYEMFSFRRITLAPFLVLLGFGVEAFAIMKRFNK